MGQRYCVCRSAEGRRDKIVVPPESPPPGELRWCCICKDYLPITEFGPDITRKDGLQRQCRECKNNMSKRYERRRKQRKIVSINTSKL